jgi:hypothetical protein
MTGDSLGLFARFSLPGPGVAFRRSCAVPSDREVKLVMKPGQPQSTVCLCDLGMTWDGDCHVIWNGGEERRIKATHGPGSPTWCGIEPAPLHDKGRDCARTEEVLEAYRLRAIRAELEVVRLKRLIDG